MLPRLTSRQFLLQLVAFLLRDEPFPQCVINCCEKPVAHHVATAFAYRVGDALGAYSLVVCGMVAFLCRDRLHSGRELVPDSLGRGHLAGPGVHERGGVHGEHCRPLEVGSIFFSSFLVSRLNWEVNSAVSLTVSPFNAANISLAEA